MLLPNWVWWISLASIILLVWAGSYILPLRRRKVDLNLGGIALRVVLNDLKNATNRSSSETQSDADLSHIISMAHSALAAFRDSSTWNKTAGDTQDHQQQQQQLGAVLIDALKLTDVGGSAWRELKRALDEFDKHVTNQRPAPT